MGSHFKIIGLIIILFFGSCKHSFDEDLNDADFIPSNSAWYTSVQKNILFSEFLNWDSIAFEYAYKEAATNWTSGAYVFISTSNFANDTLRLYAEPTKYNVKEGYYLYCSINGFVNKYSAQKLDLDSYGSFGAFYRPLNEHEGELLFNNFVSSRIRIPDPNGLRRMIRGRFIIPRL